MFEELLFVVVELVLGPFEKDKSKWELDNLGWRNYDVEGTWWGIEVEY